MNEDLLLYILLKFKIYYFTKIRKVFDFSIKI